MKEKYDPSMIEVISAAQVVRARPRMYLGECFDKQTLDILPIESACHAIDEYLDGKCEWLKIFVGTEFFEIQYDAGMSLELYQAGQDKTIAEIIMTELFACKNIKKHIHVGDDHCRLGIAIINFTSEWCEVSTNWNGQKGVFRFDTGERSTRKFQSTDQKNSTSIRVRPDQRIFGGLWFTYEGVSEKAAQLSAKLSGFPIVVERG